MVEEELKMQWTDWDRAVLALMMWREYRSLGVEGMRPCGHVAHNRAIRDKQPIHVIITRDAQFSSINPPKKTYDPQLDVWPQQPDVRFAEAMQLAEGILTGALEDNTGGALFYWNPKYAKDGGWFSRNIAFRGTPLEPRNGHKVTLVSGEHIFYT